MNQARITLKPGVEIIAVEVPGDAIDFYPENGGITLWVNKEIDCIPIGIQATEVKKEDTIIGRFTELSEEQCAPLVTSIHRIGYADESSSDLLVGYKNYRDVSIYLKLDTAKKSLQTALEANNIDRGKALIIKVNQ